MTGRVSTAAAATPAPASACAPPAGWASSASIAGAASGEWKAVLEGRAQPEAEAEGRSRWMPDRKWGGRAAPRCFEDRSLPGRWSPVAWGLPAPGDGKVRGRGGGTPKGFACGQPPGVGEGGKLRVPRCIKGRLWNWASWG